MMRSGERVKEFLRPFVASRAWDFCIIWKLGDDPSRFIEWVGCCCSGSYIEKNIKLENVEEATERKKIGSTICRDEHNKHHIKTLACEALSHFPLFMPLYPGIHGEVVMSKSPKWLVNSGPGSKKNIFSTRVLVPVRDGLIELFSFIMKPVDESMVDLIISRCNAFFEPFPEQTLQLRIFPRAEESMSSGVNLSFECGGGSSSVSNPSSENQALFGNPNARFGEPCLVLNKEEEDVVMQDTIELKANKKLPKENFKSKNLHSERKRRDRINQGIYALRSIVPRITKMNKNGTLSDAVDYIKELLVEKKKLEDELNGINEMECTETAAKEESAVANPEAEKIVAKLNKKVNNEVNLEVHEIGERDFLIKVAQEHKRDGFKRLIEAVDSCGLEIVDVNFSRLNLTVVTLLNVKANKDGIASRNLRDLLLEKMATSESVKH
uniref:Transcription factor bHLH90 n=1 Tax=Noccaea caerulescens TaxID=107243 RepID=A0A1J3JBR2_NOCCA